MKASTILLKASEGIHMQGTYDDYGVNGRRKVSHYCALGLLRCKGGFYSKSVKQPEALSRTGLTQAILHDTKAKCPSCGQKDNLWYTIIHLNDTHKATFAEIGKFLKELGY